MYPLPEQSVFPLQEQRIFCFLDKSPVSAWKKLSKFRLEWKNLIADSRIRWMYLIKTSLGIIRFYCFNSANENTSDPTQKENTKINLEWGTVFKKDNLCIWHRGQDLVKQDK